ncbi:MAG TPA: peptidase C1 [Bacteroidetes bacterium]|nr:peptidase C1 [Bacteroidota bacterium]
MLKKTNILLLITVFLFGSLSVGMAQDKAVYVKKKYGKRERQVLTFDFSKIKKPASVAEMNPVFHNPPIHQDTTGTCWCFATTSFLESEVYRLHQKKVKISEIFTVYHEYLEKVRRYVREKGNSAFAEGSEHNAVIHRMKQYGAVPESAYTGLIDGRTGHNHGPMVREMRNYLQFIKQHNYWHEDEILANIRNILNRYLGEPPKTVTVDGQIMTPKEYLKNVLQLPLNDYVAFMSTKSLPFYTKGEYKVPDNWWHSTAYHNVPLNEFYGIIKNAIKNGYSVDLGGDVSEPGKNGENEVAVIPSFDIPGKYINQDSREFRFYNHTSTDDHAIHLIGYKRVGKHDWFLIKDSGRSAYAGPSKGYYFFRDDFIKLKMLTILVHKDAAKEVLKKFNLN